MERTQAGLAESRLYAMAKRPCQEGLACPNPSLPITDQTRATTTLWGVSPD